MKDPHSSFLGEVDGKIVNGLKVVHFLPDWTEAGQSEICL